MATPPMHAPDAAPDRHSLLLDSIGEGIFGIDLDGRCTFVNPAALSLLGYRTQTFGRSGNAIWSRVHDEDRTALRQSLLPLGSGMQP